MHLPNLKRFSRGPAVLVAIPVFLAAAALSNLALTSTADAKTNRRICKYVWMQGVGNDEGRSVSFVLNYKRSGACPRIDDRKVKLPRSLGLWMPPKDAWEKQPAPKMTCEEFQWILHLPSSRSGGDPCTYMTKDRLYGATSWKEGDPNPPDPNKTRLWDLGHVDDLRA